MHLINYFVYYCVFSPRFVFWRWFSRNGENHAKSMQREQKGSKDVKAKNPTARNMSTGWKSLRKTCRQVWCRQQQQQRARHARGGRSAQRPSSRLGHESSRLVWTCRQDEMHVNEHVDIFVAVGLAEETLAAARTEEPRNLAQSDEKINIFQSKRNFAMRSTEKL